MRIALPPLALKLYIRPLRYRAFKKVWPSIVAAAWNLLALVEHPLVRRFIEPVFRATSPFLLPIATACMGYSTGSALIVGIASGVAFSPHQAIILSGQALCSASALLSTAVLGVHAVSRALRWPQTDPLRSAIAATALHNAAYLISLPWQCVYHLAQSRFVKAALQEVCCAVERCFQFAQRHPFITPVLVVIGLSGLALTGGLTNWSTRLLQFGSDGARSLVATMIKVRQGPLNAAADSTLVLALVAASQIAVFSLVAGVCKALPSRQADPVRIRVPTRPLLHQGGGHGMNDRMQCWRFIGPRCFAPTG